MSWVDDWKRGLDLERLHGPHTERQSGRTMAYIATMFGEAMLGQPGNNYLYVAETYSIKTWVIKDFREILEYEGVSVVPNGQRELHTETTRFFIKGWQGVRTFDFMHISQLETNCCGKKWDRAFLDVSPVRKIQFARGIDILKSCSKDGEHNVY